MNNEVKPGWKTTEAWLTALTELYILFGGQIPEPWNAVIASALVAVYVICRTILKKKVEVPKSLLEKIK